MIVGQEVSPTPGPLLAKISEANELSLSSPAGVPASPKDVAEYSADILTELGGLVADAGLTFLAYLIQVAVEEAKIQAEDLQNR